jgi:hypothetical protein
LDVQAWAAKAVSSCAARFTKSNVVDHGQSQVQHKL